MWNPTFYTLFVNALHKQAGGILKICMLTPQSIEFHKTGQSTRPRLPPKNTQNHRSAGQIHGFLYRP